MKKFVGFVKLIAFWSIGCFSYGFQVFYTTEVKTFLLKISNSEELKQELNLHSKEGRTAIKRLLKKNLQEYSKIYAKFLLEQEGTEIASQLGPERTLFISFFSILITNFFTNPSYFQLKNGDEAVALWMEIRENLNQMKHGLENDL